MTLASPDFEKMRKVFGERLQTGVELARYTSARVGGPADALLVANTARELAEITTALWKLELPFLVLGGGSNVLVSDAGVRGVVVLNRAHKVRFSDRNTPPTVWAESGANFGGLARLAAVRGLSGLEWAAGIPGTLGGAVLGNAGAFENDMSGNLVMAKILHHLSQMEKNHQASNRIETWPVERFEYTYRNSILKRQPGSAVVLAARLRLAHSTPEAVQARMGDLSIIRHRKQPPGASTGSMFKNPPGNYAGRLIEAVGLKGAQVGEAQISSLHANFFINQGNACARDFYHLIKMAQVSVMEKFGIGLELEIQLVGEWPVERG
jgi:UDP-N-acetylmuramate dehydrogenase